MTRTKEQIESENKRLKAEYGDLLIRCFGGTGCVTESVPKSSRLANAGSHAHTKANTNCESRKRS